MTHKINYKQINQFRQTGVLKLKNFFEKNEISKLKVNISKKIKSKNSFDSYYEKINGKRLLRRIEKLSKNSKDFYNLLNQEKLVNLFKKITKEKFNLFKDKLNFKYPKSEGFSHHIDGHWFWFDKKNNKKKGWRKYGKKFINIVIPLENVTIKNGCLYLGSKKDTFKFLGKSWEQITSKIKNNNQIFKKKFKFKPFPMSTGDLLIFDWRVCHYSKRNMSKNSRMIVYATFSDKKNQMVNYYLDKKKSKSSSKQKVFF